MKENINILFIGGAKRLSLAERFINAGTLLGRKINLFSYELSIDVPICSMAKVIIGLKWKDDRIFEHLSYTIINEKIDIVIPNVDPAISILAELKKNEQLEKTVLLVSEKEICNVFFNKATANEWFKQNSFEVPENNLDNFPLIAKPLTGSASRGILIIRNQDELKKFKETNQIENYLLQRYIDSEEYTVDCYVSYRNKEILAIVPRKRLEVIDGEVSKSITTYDKELIAISKQIIEKGGFVGPLNIQFLKEKSTNKIYVMEINPRFGGGVINSIEAGANMPIMVLNDFLGIENKKVENWRSNLLMMRANREVFVCK